MISKELNKVIQEIVSSSEFWRLNYYMRSMKETPHSGVFHINYPNKFMKYNICQVYRFFVSGTEIPFPVVSFVDHIKKYLNDFNNQEEILRYCLGVNLDKPKFNDGSRMYIANSGEVVNSNNRSEMEHMVAVSKAIQGEINFTDNFTINNERLAYLFILTLVEEQINKIECLNEIVDREQLLQTSDKYGLVNITDAKFERQGFVLENEYYLYNIFFDTSIGNPMSAIPNTIDIMCNIQSKIEIWMRCDSNLAVPVEKKISTAGVGFQKWRGITLDFGNIKEQLQNGKETIVHYDEETMNKILVYIKQDQDEMGNDFYHFNVEQLWNPDVIRPDEEIIITNYVHGTYYKDTEMFEHIDFSVNQYDVDIYIGKYQDSKEATGISIGEYANFHYKIWCIKGEDLTSQIWANLVCATLDIPFRKIFMETIGSTYIVEE